MGPEDIIVATNYLLPPNLPLDPEKLYRREEVKEWAQKVEKWARIGDKRAKGVDATMEYTLNQSINSETKESGKRKLRTGEIVFIPLSDIEN